MSRSHVTFKSPRPDFSMDKLMLMVEEEKKKPAEIKVVPAKKSKVSFFSKMKILFESKKEKEEREEVQNRLA